MATEEIKHDSEGMYLVRTIGEYNHEVYQQSSGVIVASAALYDTAMQAASALNACAVVHRLKSE